MTDAHCDSARKRCQAIIGTIFLLLWAGLGVLLWRQVATETTVASGKATREAQYESLNKSLGSMESNISDIKRSLDRLKIRDLRAEPSP